MRKPWLARIVRLLSLTLVMIGLAGIGVAASRPGAALSPVALLSAVLDPSTPVATTSGPVTPAPALGSSAGADVWLAPARATGGDPPPPGSSPPSLSAPPPVTSTTTPVPCPPPASTPVATVPPAVALNRAEVNELMRLPGIGRRRAEAIIELRTRLGGFKRPSDLLRVRGIGTRSLERLLPLIVIDEPPAPSGAPAPQAKP